MKPLHTFLLGTAAILSLASCELKNELSGSLVNKEDTGAIELGVSVKQPVSQTRADASEIDTNTYPVVIQGTSDGVTDVTYEYNTLSEMPASIIVPVGQYTISSHTPGTLEKQMDTPYYAGSTDITVSKDIASKTDIVCRMANSRIQLNYGEDFKAAFSQWTITINDGSEMALAYTQEDLNPTPVYWHFNDNVTAITVNIRAVTTEGNTVTESRTFRKIDASENYEEVGDAFTGGDALEINMGTVTSSTGDLEGIDINTNITFEDSSESVEIPTIDETEEPEEPTDPSEPGEGGEGTEGAVTLNLPVDVTYSISAGDAPASADAYIASEAGLDKIIVTITAGNDAFQAILVDLTMDGQSFLAENGGDLIEETALDACVLMLRLLADAGEVEFGNLHIKEFGKAERGRRFQRRRGGKSGAQRNVAEEHRVEAARRRLAGGNAGEAALHVVGPHVILGRHGGVNEELHFLHDIAGRQADLTVLPPGEGEAGAVVDGGRQHVPFVVIGVIAEHLNAPGRIGDDLRGASVVGGKLPGQGIHKVLHGKGGWLGQNRFGEREESKAARSKRSADRLEGSAPDDGENFGRGEICPLYSAHVYAELHL